LAAYEAALDREEHASALYAALIHHVADLAAPGPEPGTELATLERLFDDSIGRVAPLRHPTAAIVKRNSGLISARLGLLSQNMTSTPPPPAVISLEACRDSATASIRSPPIRLE
jgi:hypothetical protein